MNESPTANKNNEKYLIFFSVIIVCLVFGMLVVYFIQTHEDADAIEFFNEYKLSTEGLTRKEIKAVYRDISEKRFSYEKTGEVTKQVVSGWDIKQYKATKEEIKKIWEEKAWLQAEDSSENNGSRCNTYDLSYIKNIIFASKDDRTVWRLSLEHGFQSEYIFDAFEDEDGSIIVISKADVDNLCFCRLDKDGNEVEYNSSVIGAYIPSGAISSENGYIITAFDPNGRFDSIILMLDHEGNITKKFSFENATYAYCINKIITYAGHVILSANALPFSDVSEHEYDDSAYNRAWAVGEQKKYDSFGIPDDVVTVFFRDQYKAALLVFNAKDETPELFYEVESSFGEKLFVNDMGELVWEVRGIESAHYSPLTDAFSFNGTCEVYEYIFGKNGYLKSKNDTGNTAVFTR